MSFDTRVEQSVLERYGFSNDAVLPYTVALLSGLLLVECLLFVIVPSVGSYETSLVAAFPLTFWALFYAVLLGGIGTLLASAATGRAYWPHGLALVLANYGLFFFLPAARGYRLYGRGISDILRHLGDVQGIIGSGSLPGIWYPGTHVLMAELTMLGVPMGSVRYVVAFVFTALHIAGIGLLVRLLAGRKEGSSIGLAAATPLVYAGMHISTQPAVVSFLMLPVFIAVLERYRQTRHFAYVAVLLLLGLFTVYTHPMTTLILSVIVGVAAAYSQFHDRVSPSDVPTLSPRLAAIFPMLLFAWIINFRQFRVAIDNLVNPDGGASPGAATAQEAAEVSFTLAELLAKFVTLYGTVALYGLTAGVVSLFVVRRFLDGAPDYEFGLGTAQLGAGIGIAGVFVLNSLILGNIIRASRYALLFAAVLVALGLLNRMVRGDGLGTALLVLVVVSTAVVGVNATYEPNRHLTYSEYDGTEYLLTNTDSEIHNWKTDNRMEEYVLGTNNPTLYPPQMRVEDGVPDRLGYQTDDTTAADTYGDAMVVTKAYDMEQHTASYYTDAQQEFLFQYDERSVERLGNDRTANKVYTNGGFDGWDVRTD
jgi:hypothetical protein